MSRAADALSTFQLRALCALLTERSVTRAAIRLNQSQPAISAVLRRLRELFGDELLVRSGQAMVPTARGLEVLEAARTALVEIDRLFVATEAFDPATTQQAFRVGCPDYLATVFLANAVHLLRAQAPGAQLLVHPLGPAFDFEQALARGELDIVIGNWPEPPPNLHMASLLVDDIVCLLWAEHPLASRPMSVDEYLQAPHVVPLPFSSTHRGVIDRHLASLRMSRQARVTVPFFSMAPHMLPSTDLIFTISRHFAVSYARLLPLAVVPCPIDFPPMHFYQIWHPRNHHAASHRWLRALLKTVADSTIAPGRPESSQRPREG